MVLGIIFMIAVAVVCRRVLAALTAFDALCKAAYDNIHEREMLYIRRRLRHGHKKPMGFVHGYVFEDLRRNQPRYVIRHVLLHPEPYVAFSKQTQYLAGMKKPKPSQRCWPMRYRLPWKAKYDIRNNHNAMALMLAEWELLGSSHRYTATRNDWSTLWRSF